MSDLNFPPQFSKPAAAKTNSAAMEAQAYLDRLLIVAATRSNSALLTDCLARGGNPMAADDHGHTALMWAGRFDMAKNAQILLPLSDVEQRSADGRRAIEMARSGAGEGSSVARIIESYMLAQKELAALSQSAAVAAKKTPRRYGL